MDCSTNEWPNAINVWFHDNEINMWEKLVMLMPDHVKQVTATKGGHINYQYKQIILFHNKQNTAVSQIICKTL